MVPEGGVVSFLFRANRVLCRKGISPTIYKNFWYQKAIDFGDVVEGGACNHIVFFDSNEYVYDSQFLIWLKSTIPNADLTLVFMNSVANRSMRDIGYFKAHFDSIYSFDRADCTKYGFSHFEQVYSNTRLRNAPAPTNDVAFVGLAKSRTEQLERLYFSLQSRGINCSFNVVGYQGACKSLEGTWMSYEDALRYDLSGRCILEITDGAQGGLTLRACEAIAFDRYLITDVPGIKDSRYFDPARVFVLDGGYEIEELVGFVVDARKELPNWGYEGDFSPRNLLRQIAMASEKSA